MAERLSIVIPSHRRAGAVKAINAVTDPILCVEESQRDEYADAYPETRIDTHPDSIVGLTAKRQWIYENYGTVFMLDDDVPYFVHLGRAPGEEPKVPPAMARALIEQACHMAEGIGAYLFGFNNVLRPEQYLPHKPFALQGYIPGHSTGIRAGSKLYWNANLRTTDDYWISALNAYHYRVAYKDLRYAAMQAGTFTSLGGQASHRTMAAERESTEILNEYFGDVIQRKRKASTTKLAHSEQRSLRLPY